VLGGVEATIRRFTHFDYKSNELRRGILNDTKADLLLFGNADRSILILLDRIKKAMYGKGKTDLERVSSVIDLSTINGLAFRVKKNEIDESIRKLPSFEECVKDKKKFSLLTRTYYLLPDDSFIEPCGLGFIQHNRLQHTLQEAELDYVYELPFTRKLHPKAKNFNTNNGMVARLETSVILGRGCWGSCNFCVIPLVQGKNIAKRSKKSILREIENLYKDGFEKIADLTLPTINMYGSYCSLYDSPEVISSPIIKKEITVFNKKKYCNQQCVGCENRVLSNDLIPLLNDVKILHKKYRGTSLELRSAIRHDIILEQEELFKSIMEFINRLKIAPEHINDNVLKQMNKGDRKNFVKFLELYDKVNLNKKNLVPYFVAGHPGTTKEDMQDLKKFCDENKLYVNLTQVFTPTPGTASTSMYYTAENPLTKEEVYVPRTFREKKDQKNILLIDDELVDDNA